MNSNELRAATPAEIGIEMRKARKLSPIALKVELKHAWLDAMAIVGTMSAKREARLMALTRVADGF